ncbi:hypothetical protein MNBD_NITROSPINAE04-945 [hydrothermal vent metagenome]|uniref:Uncharacterized protein n=1 Tax=hydrothermal vent metagenome TaxID=652676 RepID=A0A3B1C4C9_9ZZZZ
MSSNSVTIKKYCALCLVFVFTAGACSYSLVGRGSSLPADVRSVNIPIFRNFTGEPDIETIVTRVIRGEFIKDGRLKVDDSSSSDSTLTGEIRSYTLKPLAYDQDNNVTEYLVTLSIFLVHKNNHTGKILQKRKVDTTWQYPVDPSISLAESLRQNAIETAAFQASDTIISLIIESF